MSEQDLARLRAAAWTLAAEDWREAVKALRRLAAEIENQQWKGPNNR